jgi:hypothetical protein|tara:strand:+ start:61 stop:705 length:645 start_codon:yes stop_codon:yes gene_type:complete
MEKGKITFPNYLIQKIILIITLLVSFPFAEKVLQHKSEILHPKIVNTLKEFKKVNFWVEYGIESYKPSLRTYKSPYINDEVIISFTNENLAIFLNHIEKYFKWNNVAIENNVTNDKKIGATKITLSWEHGNDNWNTQETTMITHFFSQNENRHQFVLMFYELSFSDGWVKFKQPTMYFDYNDVVRLKQLLDSKYVKSTVEEWKEKQKEVDKLFE